jgi:penicillin-binding protein 1A
MTTAEAYLTTSLLTSVVETGTARAARSLHRPLAGKTGTSNDARDAWFVGYSPELVCGVWTGYDDGYPLGSGEAGATVALPVFIDFVREALQNKPAADFAVPPGIVHVPIDPQTGLRAAANAEGAIDELFLSGTEPPESSPELGSANAAASAGPSEQSAPAAASPSPEPAPLVPVEPSLKVAPAP